MGEYHYAVALAKGIGTKADPEAARHWMQRAADHGSRDAVLALSDGLTN
jgi:TPR repeat protein